MNIQAKCSVYCNCVVVPKSVLLQEYKSCNTLIIDFDSCPHLQLIFYIQRVQLLGFLLFNSSKGHSKAVHLPLADSTAMFTMRIVRNRQPPCAVTVLKTCTDKQRKEWIPKQCPHQRSKFNVLATNQ